MESFKYIFKVSYSETDRMGIVHHSNYAKYCENARWEAFRSLGLSYSEIENSGIILPVVDMALKYVKPAKYDDTLTIQVRFVRIFGAKLRIEYDIFNEYNELINSAHTTLAFVDEASGKPCRAPEFISSIFKTNFLGNIK